MAFAVEPNSGLGITGGFHVQLVANQPERGVGHNYRLQDGKFTVLPRAVLAVSGMTGNTGPG